MGWCYVCVRCESGFSVYMAGPGICVLCLADTCTSKVHQDYLYTQAPKLTHTHIVYPAE